MNKYLFILVILCIILVIFCIIKKKKKEKIKNKESFQGNLDIIDYNYTEPGPDNTYDNYKEIQNVNNIISNINNYSNMITYFGNSCEGLSRYDMVDMGNRGGWTRMSMHEEEIFKLEAFSGILLKLIDIEATTVLDNYDEDKMTKSGKEFSKQQVLDWSVISPEIPDILKDNKNIPADKYNYITDNNQNAQHITDKSYSTGKFNNNVKDAPNRGVNIYATEPDTTIIFSNMYYITDIKYNKFQIPIYTKNKIKITFENIEELIGNKYNQLFGSYFKNYKPDSENDKDLHWDNWTMGNVTGDGQQWLINSLMIYPDTSIFNHPEITTLLKYYVINEFSDLSFDSVIEKVNNLKSKIKFTNQDSMNDEDHQDLNWTRYPEENNKILYRNKTMILRGIGPFDNFFGSNPDIRRICLNGPYGQINEWKTKRKYFMKYNHARDAGHRSQRTLFATSRGRFNFLTGTSSAGNTAYGHSPYILPTLIGEKAYMNKPTLRVYYEKSLDKFNQLSILFEKIFKKKLINIDTQITLRLKLNAFIESLNTYIKDDIFIGLRNKNEPLTSQDDEIRTTYDEILKDGSPVSDYKNIKIFKLKPYNKIVETTTFKEGLPVLDYHINKVMQVNNGIRFYGFYTYYNSSYNTRNSYMIKFNQTYFGDSETNTYKQETDLKNIYKNIYFVQPESAGVKPRAADISIHDMASIIINLNPSGKKRLEDYYSLDNLINYYENNFLYIKKIITNKIADGTSGSINLNKSPLVPFLILKNYKMIEYLTTRPTNGTEIQKIIDSNKTPNTIAENVNTNLIQFYNKISHPSNDYTRESPIEKDQNSGGTAFVPTLVLFKNVMQSGNNYTYLKYIFQKYFEAQIKGITDFYINTDFQDENPLYTQARFYYYVNISKKMNTIDGIDPTPNMLLDTDLNKIDTPLILLDKTEIENNPDYFFSKYLFTYKFDPKGKSLQSLYIENYINNEKIPGVDGKPVKNIYSVKNKKGQYIFFYTKGDNAYVLNKKHKFEKYNPADFLNYEYSLITDKNTITEDNFTALSNLSKNKEITYLKENPNLFKRPIIIKNKTTPSYVKSIITGDTFEVGSNPSNIDFATMNIYTNTEKGYHGKGKYKHPLYLKNDYIYCYYKDYLKEKESFKDEDKNYDTRNLIRGFHCSERTFNNTKLENLINNPAYNKLAKHTIIGDNKYPLMILDNNKIVYVNRYQVVSTDNYSIVKNVTAEIFTTINYSNSDIPLKFYFKDINNQKNLLYFNDIKNIERTKRLDNHAQYNYKVKDYATTYETSHSTRTTLFMFKNSNAYVGKIPVLDTPPVENDLKKVLNKYYTFDKNNENVFVYNKLNNGMETTFVLTFKNLPTFITTGNNKNELVYSCETTTPTEFKNIQIELNMPSNEATYSSNKYLNECIGRTNKLYYSLFNHTLYFLKNNLYKTLKERLREKIDNIKNRDKNINKTIEETAKKIKLINTKIGSYLDIITEKVQPIIRDILFKNYQIYNTRLTIIQIKENYQNKIKFRINLTRNDEYVKELHYLIIQTNLEIVTLKQSLENKRQLSLEQLLETNAIIEVANDKIKLIEEKLSSLKTRESFQVTSEDIFNKFEVKDLSSITVNKTIPIQLVEFLETMKSINLTLKKISTTDSVIKEHISYYDIIKNYLSFIKTFDRSIAFKSKIIEQKKQLFTIKVNVDNKYADISNKLEELKRLYDIDDLSTIDIQFDNVNKNILEMKLIELEQEKEFINQDIKNKNKTLRDKAQIQLKKLKEIDETIIRKGLMNSNVYEGFSNKNVKEGFQSQMEYLGEKSDVVNLINTTSNYQNIKNEFYKNIHSIESLNNNEQISINPIEENNVYKVLVNDKCVTVYDDIKYDLKDCKLPYQSQFFEPILIKNEQDALKINKSECINEDVNYPYYQMVSSVTGNCLTLDDEGMNLTPCNSNSITQHWKLNKNEKICIDN